MISAARIAKLEKAIRLRAKLMNFDHDIPQFAGGVYRIRNTKTNDCYIGASSNLRIRAAGHPHMLSFEMHTKLIQKAVKRYGIQSLVFEILIICAPEHLEMYETACIKRFQPAYNTRV